MQFNTHQFNESLFNLEEETGDFLTLLLTESISYTDDQEHTPNKVLQDLIFLNDDLHGRISAKGLAEVLYLADWFTIKRDTRQSRWFD